MFFALERPQSTLFDNRSGFYLRGEPRLLSFDPPSLVRLGLRFGVRPTISQDNSSRQKAQRYRYGGYYEEFFHGDRIKSPYAKRNIYERFLR